MFELEVKTFALKKKINNTAAFTEWWKDGLNEKTIFTLPRKNNKKNKKFLYRKRGKHNFVYRVIKKKTTLHGKKCSTVYIINENNIHRFVYRGTKIPAAFWTAITAILELIKAKWEQDFALKARLWL